MAGIHNLVPTRRHNRCVTKIVTVASAKGGVGKSTIAYELATLLDAPLVDLDWEDGSSTVAWGYDKQYRSTTPMLRTALANGRIPNPVSGRHKPDLVPCYKNFVNEQPAADDIRDALEKWAGEWGRPYVVVDTHPGGCSSTFGAMSAASVIVTPVILGIRELAALQGWLEELRDYPFLVIPNRLTRGIPKAWSLRQLSQIVREAGGVPVGPPISEYSWLRDRQRRMALTADPEGSGVRVRKVAADMEAVAEAVRTYG
jgi:chromosome partitioning protein